MSSVCATSSPPRSGGSSAHRARQGTQRQALLATRSAGGAGTETAASADISSSCARPQVRSPQAVRGLLRGRVQEWRTPSRERPRRACPSPQSSEAFRALRPAERRGPSAISPNRDDLPLIAARASRTWPQHCSSLLHGNRGASLISTASAQPRSCAGRGKKVWARPRGSRADRGRVRDAEPQEQVDAGAGGRRARRCHPQRKVEDGRSAPSTVSRARPCPPRASAAFARAWQSACIHWRNKKAGPR